MPTDRRDFLQRLTMGAVTLSVLPAVSPAALHAEGAPSHGREEIAAFLEATAPAEPWDVSWTEKLTGKHRAVFDAPAVDGGVGVFRSGLWQNQVAEVFKPSPSDINSVVVLRHEAIILAMGQPFWDEYEIGKRHKVKDGNDKKTTKNPALVAEGSGASPNMIALSLDKQMARGTIVLACGLAFRSVVADVMGKHKLKPDEARTRALAALVPGIIMQPSGFFATTLAGEHGCVYVRAS